MEDSAEFAAEGLHEKNWSKKGYQHKTRGNYKLYDKKPQYNIDPPTTEEIKKIHPKSQGEKSTWAWTRRG